MLRRPDVVFVDLVGSHELIAQRMAARQGHYMPTSLLDSQFATLEPPGPDERVITVDVGEPPAAETARVITTLHLRPEPGSSTLGAERPGESRTPTPVSPAAWTDPPSDHATIREQP